MEASLSTQDSLEGHVGSRLGLAGRGSGTGFDVGHAVCGGASHANRGRGSLGLTRRGRPENYEPHAEGSMDTQSAAPHDEHVEQGDGGDANARRRRNTYTDEQKQSIYAMILERTTVGKLDHGVTKIVSNTTGVPWRVVQRIWYAGQKGGGINSVVSKTKTNGRKKKDFDSEIIKTVPLRKRTTLKDLANEIG
ncbi:hypothetical protein GUJ93_ZPchr0009g187 [Zizania palustris]|uniref:DUF7769 domain-containing protein n=1 Tax=Zizania palustris TaxID=103762 RepID=A0A8J5RG92_ZIZPA|nr:hypothetical protein GUJ93_ZPchr0009g187 [Zizania palustris]